MKCLCNLHCKFLKHVDMFGKEPELYYKGESKKLLGLVEFFQFYLLLYILHFLFIN